MYKNSNSVIRVNNTVRDKFDVKVGFIRVVLYPFLFVVAPEALSWKCRSTLPLEMVYADDFVIIAVSLVELNIWYAARKHYLVSKGLRVTLSKTKVMISGINKRPNLYLWKAPMWKAQIPSFEIIVLTGWISVVVDRTVD